VYVIFPFLDIAYTIFIINAAARNKLLLPLLSSQFLRHYLIVHDLYRTFFPTDDNVSRYYKLMINHEVPLSSSLGIALDYHTRFSLSKTRFSWIKRIFSDEAWLAYMKKKWMQDLESLIEEFKASKHDTKLFLARYQRIAA
jgi:hypothetical protein